MCSHSNLFQHPQCALATSEAIRVDLAHTVMPKGKMQKREGSFSGVALASVRFSQVPSDSRTRAVRLRMDETANSQNGTRIASCNRQVIVTSNALFGLLRCGFHRCFDSVPTSTHPIEDDA